MVRIHVAGALLGAQSILAAGIDGQVVDGDDAPIAGALITSFGLTVSTRRPSTATTKEAFISTPRSR